MNVSQAKLNIGLRTTIHNRMSEQPALNMANAILGGFSQSKLFTQVREQHSLAYSVSSRMIDSSLGLLMISAGIDLDKKQMTYDIICRQLEDLQAGKITDSEMKLTKALLINGITSLADSAHSLIDYDFSGVFRGLQRTPAEQIRNYEQMALDEICEAARTIWIDTIYHLTGEDTGGEQ
jgi:hypothetical protein